MAWTATRYPGIQVNHRKGCPAPEKRCRCTPAYRARVGRNPFSKSFPTLAAAQTWQADERKQGTTPAASGETFGQLWDRWLAGAQSGQIATKGKDKAPYRPRTLTIYESMMDLHVLPGVIDGAALKDWTASALTVRNWQAFVDTLRREHNLSRNTLEVIMNPVRAVYRWACAPSRRILPANATTGVEMPAADEVKRDRIVPREQAPQYIAALSQPTDQVDFGLALYAGMRNMERIPLDWSWIDWKRGLIDVRVSKSKAGLRKLPIIGRLRPILLREWLRQGKPTSGRVVLAPEGRKISLVTQARRATQEWKAAGLERRTPHEMRHTFASYLIASGLNAKAVTVLMGHESITTTFDRYGKLFKGSEDEAASMLDAYLGTDEENPEEGTGHEL